MHVLTSADTVAGQSFLWNVCLCVYSPMSAVPWISGFCCPVSIVGQSLYFMHRNLNSNSRAVSLPEPNNEASACKSEKAPVGMSDAIHDLAVSTKQCFIIIQHDSDHTKRWHGIVSILISIRRFRRMNHEDEIMRRRRRSGKHCPSPSSSCLHTPVVPLATYGVQLPLF